MAQRRQGDLLPDGEWRNHCRANPGRRRRGEAGCARDAVSFRAERGENDSAFRDDRRWAAVPAAISRRGGAIATVYRGHELASGDQALMGPLSKAVPICEMCRSRTPNMKQCIFDLLVTPFRRKPTPARG